MLNDQKQTWSLQEMGPALNQYLLHVIKLIAMMIISTWQPEMKAMFLIKQNHNPVFKKKNQERNPSQTWAI